MKIFKVSNIALLFAGMLAFSSCEEYKPVDYSKYAAEEMALLHTFLTEDVKYGPDSIVMSRLDSLTITAIDTVDYYHDNAGVLIFNKKVGEGEPVVAGKTIGYRYKSYAILDSAGFARVRYAGSNYGDLEPVLATAGKADSYSGYYSGINSAIMQMNRFSKSTVIVPSTLGNNSFITYIYDLEVVYISK